MQNPIAILAVSIALCGTVACSGPAAEAHTPGSEERVELTDPQIAHIAVTANAIDVELARLAEPRSTDQQVLGFAGTMIRDHSAVIERAAALAERLGVTPEDNPVSQSLQDGAEEARAALAGLQGGAFDRAYLAREVAYHQAVLDALDQTLIPGATNAELRGLLEEVRPVIAAHLQHAATLALSVEAER